MSITDNVEASNTADEVHRLASSEALRFTGDAALRFWRRLLENVCAVIPPQYHPTRVDRSDVVPMTREELREWEIKKMPFGKHEGTQVKNVPLDYLIWLDEQPDFRRELKRYLKSDRIQREIDLLN